MIDLTTLNEAQHEAVVTTEGPLLVLAGAGSGKTRVLTYRIAHLVQDLGVHPWNILAVTFTNKAATEMRERLSTLLSGGTRGMWVNTFHSMCVRILRSDAERIGYSNDFTIYDADDMKTLVKSTMANHGYDTKAFPDAAVRSKISSMKNELITPEMCMDRVGDYFDKVVAEVYRSVQATLRRSNAMDFDDLLMNAYQLLAKNPDIAQAYGTRFKYILVDEYQDTNHAQYAIANLLAKESGNLMVVGDDDQSIYSWRGADIRNILDFEKDWPDAKTVKLERNYRSTSNILDAANAVIANNEGRKDKALYTEDGAGEKINVYLAADVDDEGRWIAGECRKLNAKGVSYNDMAVFFRTNTQADVINRMLRRAGIDTHLVKGTDLFSRKEVKDVIAYLTCVVNPADDMSAKRIINVPKRGIGKTTVDKLQFTAQVRDISFMEAVREEVLDPACTGRVKKALMPFIELMDELATYKGDLVNIVEMIVERAGLIPYWESQRTEEAMERAEYIRTFVVEVRAFAEANPEIFTEHADFDADGNMVEGSLRIDSHEPTINDFLEYYALYSSLDKAGSDGAVTLMSVHSAKGLEFDTVFVAGMEEGIFPHMNSVLEHGVEEERRLAYVAITRARKRLYLTHTQTRRTYSGPQCNPPSRFINEIPAELINRVGLGSKGIIGTGWEKRGDRHSTYGSGGTSDEFSSRVFGAQRQKSAFDMARTEPREKKKVVAANRPVSADFNVGDHVEHKTFGRGTVLGVDGDRLTVRFAKSGQTKKLLKDFAPIVKVE